LVIEKLDAFSASFANFAVKIFFPELLTEKIAKDSQSI